MVHKLQTARRAYAREFYAKNKDRYKPGIHRTKRRLANRNKEFLKRYLAEHPCVDCGESDPVVLEFDHVRGVNVNAVSRMADRAVGIEMIKREIEKCEVRCANCHRRITAKRRSEVKVERASELPRERLLF